MAIEKTSIQDMLQLISSLSKEKPPTQQETNIFREFSTGVSSVNNEDLQFNYNRMKNYYDKNVNSMSSDEIDNYQLLDEKYQNQSTKNTRFEVDIARKDEFTEGMINFADEYSRLTEDPNAREFTYTTSEIVDGKMTDVEHDIYLPNPEDYDGGTENLEYKNLYNKKMEEYGGVEGFNQKRQDYLDYLKNGMQRQIGTYNDYVGKLITDYQGTGRLTEWHMQEIGELDQTYSFIVDSFKDNGIIDSDERDAYQSALMQKSSDPITQFIQKDAEMKKIRRDGTTNEIQTLLKSGEKYTSDLKISNTINLLKGQIEENELGLTAFTIPKNSDFNPTNEDRTWTYGDVLDYYNGEENIDPNLSSYLSSLPQLKIQAEKELKIKDDNLIKNDGVSYLSGLEEDSWAGGLYGDKTDRRFAFTPEAPAGPPVSSETLEYLQNLPLDTSTIGPIITEPVVSELLTGSPQIIEEPEVIEEVLKNNIISSVEETKTSGNLIEIDYSDKANVKSIKTGVWLTPLGLDKKTMILNEHLKEYQNPTIIDNNSLIASIFDSRYGLREDISQNIEAFLSIYNPDIRAKFTQSLRKFWSYTDKGLTEQANKMGQQIQDMITKEDLKFPIINIDSK